MAAFSWRGGCPDRKPEKPLYIKSQPQVNLYDLSELQVEINWAEQVGSDTVYILNPGRCGGHTGIDLWYAKALCAHLESQIVSKT